MEVMKKGILILAAFSALLYACDRTWDLSDAYDNTESSKPFIPDEEEPVDDPTVDPDDGFIQGSLTGGIAYKLGPRQDIEQPSSMPLKGYWTDGKITALKQPNGKYILFWAEATSYRQEADTPWLEDNVKTLSGSDAVFGKSISKQTGFNDGGSWFIGVHSLGGDRMVGFFHAESHWNGGNGEAYKSIGVTYSDDLGKTWEKGTKILGSDETKPETPRFCGLGDGCVVWNEARKSWICYYSGYCLSVWDYVMSMAESTDDEARPGTWKKWDGSSFTGDGFDPETGIGSQNVSIDNLVHRRGANPSVMYNSYINKWIMVYHGWESYIVMSTSDDGIVWAEPTLLISRTMEPGGVMYPNMISLEGDTSGGQSFRIYYAADMVNGIRILSYRDFIFE